MRLIEQLSSFDAVQHEPFNTDRIYGAISRDFIKNGSAEKTNKRLQDILEKNRNIKHCLELLPGPFNQLLIDEAYKTGYRIFFWNRIDSFSRLVSLFLAEQTGLWENEGRTEIAAQLGAGRRSLKRISPSKFSTQSYSDANAWNEALSFCRRKKISFVYQTYEDMFEPEINRDNFMPLLVSLGLATDAHEDLINAFVASLPERPSEIAASIPNFAALRSVRLAKCRTPPKANSTMIARLGETVARVLRRY